MYSCWSMPSRQRRADDAVAPQPYPVLSGSGAHGPEGPPLPYMLGTDSGDGPSLVRVRNEKAGRPPGGSSDGPESVMSPVTDPDSTWHPSRPWAAAGAVAEPLHSPPPRYTMYHSESTRSDYS